MANEHFYFVVENIRLSNTRWQRVLDFISTLSGTGDDNSTRFQRRDRPDGQAVLCEAAFDSNAITFVKLRQMAVAAAGVAANRITVNQLANSYDSESGLLSASLVFQLDLVPQFSLTLFGVEDEGEWPGWEASHNEVLAYLEANQTAWNGS